MVFPDYTVQTTNNSKKFIIHKPAIASVADRFLAFVLDFLIFSPILGLIVAGLIRQAKVQFLVYGSFEEATWYMVLIAFLVIFCGSVLQVSFLFYFQATPGQLFTKLKVISFPAAQDRLTLNQCIIRTLTWWLSGLTMFLPLLEILSHPFRRALHDRASDTIIVTQKASPDSGPHPIESRFFASWMRMSFLMLLIMLVGGSFKTYNSLVSGELRKNEVLVAAAGGLEKSECSGESELKDFQGLNALDVRMTLFMAEALSGECLAKKADQILAANASLEETQFAYLAKYFLTEGEKKQQEYLTLLCQSPKSDSCRIAKYMSDDGTIENLKDVTAELYISRYLLSEELFAKKDFSLSLSLLTQLRKVSAFQSALEKKYVRSAWSLNEQLSKVPNRAPASKSEKFLEEFKEKYELP